MPARWSHEGADAFAKAVLPLCEGWTAERIAIEALRRKMLTFYVDGCPVGACTFDHTGPHIGVLPEWHGKWMDEDSRQKFAEEMARHRKTLIRQGNVAAQRFIEKFGWHKAGMEKGYLVYVPQK